MLTQMGQNGDFYNKFVFRNQLLGFGFENQLQNLFELLSLGFGFKKPASESLRMRDIGLAS